MFSVNRMMQDSVSEESPVATIDIPTKKVKRECKYQNEWQSHGVLPSKKGLTFALCESCGADINIGHGGLNDVKKHLATAKHQDMLKATSSTVSLKKFFRSSPVEESTTRAEVLLPTLLVSIIYRLFSLTILPI